MATAETSQTDGQPEMAQLEIRKGPEAELSVGGLRLIACRREIGEIDGGISLYVWSDPAGLAGDAEQAPVELLREPSSSMTNSTGWSKKPKQRVPRSPRRRKQCTTLWG